VTFPIAARVPRVCSPDSVRELLFWWTSELVLFERAFFFRLGRTLFTYRRIFRVFTRFVHSFFFFVSSGVEPPIVAVRAGRSLSLSPIL